MREPPVSGAADIRPADWLLAHRGYAAAYPENTLAALGAAVAAGATKLEFDIQLSADGTPFLLHDADFARTGGPARPIFELPAAEVARIPAGEPARFGDRFASERVPTLAEVAAALQGWPGVTAFVELKRHSIERFGARRVADAVHAELLPVLGQCVIISFEINVLEIFSDTYSMPIGWALREWSAAVRGQAEALQPGYLFCNVTRLPPEPEALWPGPWTWVTYEVTDPAEALRLLQRGIGIVETMQFGEMLAALASRGGR